MRVSNMLYEARLSKKMTVREVERLAGIGGRMLTAYENGKNGKKQIHAERMSLATASRVAKVLGINVVKLTEAAIEDEKENGKAEQ